MARPARRDDRRRRGDARADAPSAYDEAVAEAAAARSFERVAQTPAALARRTAELTTEVLHGTPHFVVDVHVRGHKGTRVVEIYVDTEGADVGHDALALVSREVGFLLDVEDVIDGSYTLDVSSPGLKRPLTDPRQYPKNVGRTLRVTYDDPDAGKTTVVGDLLAATDEAVELDTGTPEAPLTIPHDALREARIELPW